MRIADADRISQRVYMLNDASVLDYLNSVAYQVTGLNVTPGSRMYVSPLRTYDANRHGVTFAFPGVDVHALDWSEYFLTRFITTHVTFASSWIHALNRSRQFDHYQPSNCMLCEQDARNTLKLVLWARLLTAASLQSDGPTRLQHIDTKA